MAICTQQLKIAGIGCPILEPPAPNILAILRTDLGGRINVVNIKSAMVGKSTRHALTAQGVYDDELPRPIARVFVGCVSILVPVCLLACWRAKSDLAGIAAVLANLVVRPSVLKIALLAAILPASITESVGVHLCGLPAAGTGNDGRCCSHSRIVSYYPSGGEPKYFDIACRRIEQAQRQADLFVRQPDAPQTKTADLFAEAAE